MKRGTMSLKRLLPRALVAVVLSVSALMAVPEVSLAAETNVQVSIQAGWVNSGGRWWYRNADGSYPANAWARIGGMWYRFDASGYMLTGWYSNGGTWYYLTGSGAMAQGWLNLGGTWYWLDYGSGVMAKGWRAINGSWYYFNSSGAMATGWVRLNGTWYYLDASGAMATGWRAIGGEWYYFDADGSPHQGWLLYGGKWYWIGVTETDTDRMLRSARMGVRDPADVMGQMVTCTSNGQDAPGVAWLINGRWYYFGTDGAMQTGWVWHYGDSRPGQRYQYWFYYDPAQGGARTQEYVEG